MKKHDRLEARRTRSRCEVSINTIVRYKNAPDATSLHKRNLRYIMETLLLLRVKKIAEQVKALPEHELEEFLSWLAGFEVDHADDWDKEIARDSQPGGRLECVLKRVRKDIAEGRTAA